MARSPAPAAQDRRRGARSFEPLRDPTFRRYFAARSLSHLGDGLVVMALLFGTIGLGASPTEVGSVLLASRLPVVALTLVGGVIGDLVSRRVVMLVADVVRCVTQTTTAALLLTGAATLWQLALLQVVAGAATAFFDPAAAGLTADVVPAGRRSQANALLTATRNAVTLVAPVISAGLVATMGAGASFALGAIAFAASAVALALLRAGGTPAPGGPGLLAAARHGWRDFRSRPWLQATTIQIAVVNGVCVSPFLVLGPVIADERLGGALSWAFVGNGYAVGALLGSAVALRWRPRRPLRVAVTVPAALAPLLALLAVGAPTFVLVAAAVPAGVQSAVYAVLTETARQTHVPSELVARVTGFATVVGLAAAPVGIAVAGPAAELVGASTVLLAGAVVAVVCAPLALLVPSVRALPAEPEPDAAAGPAPGSAPGSAAGPAAEPAAVPESRSAVDGRPVAR